MASIKDEVAENDSETVRSVLVAEYSEVSEEARYRHKLIHNSYYLLVIAFGVLILPAINFLFSQQFAEFGLIAVGFGLVTSFLSGVIHVNNARRTAAYQYRSELSENCEWLAVQSQVNNLEAQEEDFKVYEKPFFNNIRESYWSNILGRNVGELSDVLTAIGVLAILFGAIFLLIGVADFILFWVN